MNRIIKAAILLLCVVLFAGCKDALEEGGPSYPLGLETHHLYLKSDTTSFEVGIKNVGWSIAGVIMDSVFYRNSLHVVADERGNRPNLYYDTLTVEWIELYRIDGGRKLKVKPQPNTTGAERSFEVLFFYPGYVHDADLKITQPSK
jgi:hypothetical protein